MSRAIRGFWARSARFSGLLSGLLWAGLVVAGVGLAWPAAAQPGPVAEPGRAGTLNGRAARDRRYRPIDTRGLSVEARLGLGRRSSWLALPVALRLRNDTGATLEGQWEIELFAEPGAPAARVLTSPVYADTGGTTVSRLLCRQRSDDPVGTASIRLRVGGAIRWQRVFHLDDGQTLSRLEAGHLHLLAVHHPQRPKRWSLRRAAPEDQVQQGVVIRGQQRTSPTPPSPGKRGMSTSVIDAWELPIVETPLMAYHAVVVVPSTVMPRLSAGQRAALARYVVFGGTVVLPSEAEAMRQALAAALPAHVRGRLTSAPRPGVDERPIACGRVLLLPSEAITGATAQGDLALRLEAGREPSLPGHLARSYYWRDELTPNASASLTQIGILFALYALLTGPVVLIVLRRRKKRTVRLYVVAVVGAFSFLALIVGPTLDFRHGDARLLTVTELTPDGGVQWGAYTLTSAGGRSHRVRLEGEEASGWVLPNPPRPNYRQWGWHGYQPDPLAQSIESLPAQELDVLLAPWGSRVLMATALMPEMKPFDVRLWFQKGELHAEVVNRTQLVLTDARILVVGQALRQYETGAYTWNAQRQTSIAETEVSQIPVSRLIRLRTLPPGVPVRGQSRGEQGHDGGYEREVGGATAMIRPPSRASLEVMLIAEVDRSLGLQLDGPFDMVPRDERGVSKHVHLLVQRITQGLPPMEQVFVSEKPKDGRRSR